VFVVWCVRSRPTTPNPKSPIPNPQKLSNKYKKLTKRINNQLNNLFIFLFN
jgi:hypothetical protein